MMIYAISTQNDIDPVAEFSYSNMFPNATDVYIIIEVFQSCKRV